MTTKEKILYEALDLFSVKGFGAVSMRDIAAKVGIKESSLYNHYSSKQAIFDGILELCDTRSSEYFRQARIVGEDGLFAADQKTVNMYGAMSPEQLAQIAGGLFETIFSDEINVKLRRLLTIEQYRDERLAKLFRQISFERSLAFQTELFKAMIGAGLFIEADPEVLALEFFSPAFLLFYRADGTPEGMVRSKALFMKHAERFGAIYSTQNKAGENADGAR
ncbi:MAG TPA: TetR/AcrR family transcriptional regulator [Clostridia bacterium]|nr:TetR/AcrR family transcriptional regulator [Clostridia bacterium]